MNRTFTLLWQPVTGLVLFLGGFFAGPALGARPPLVPTPSWPVNGATVYSTSQPLTWYLGAEAAGVTFDVRYRLVTGAYPGVPQGSGLSALRFETAGLTPGGAYRWQVRACDAGASCSAWSGEAAFEVNGPGSGAAAPVTPVASWPVGGATVYASPASLSWYAPLAPPGTLYHAYTKVCADASCASELTAGAGAGGYLDSGELAVTRHAVSVSGGEGLVWYVRSKVGGVFSAPSTLASFVMNGGPGAATATPSWPTGGAEMYTLTPSLSWWVAGSTAGLAGYEVCWGTEPTPGATPMCAAPIIKGVRETFHLVGQALNWGTTYYWHVRVIGAPGWSTASFVTTGAAGTLTPVAGWPTGGAVLYGTEATLSWYVNGASAPIEMFEVELSELGELGGTTTYFVAAPGRSRTLHGLVPGATYAWRVRSYNGNAFSPWSDPMGTFSLYAPDGAVMPIAESPVRSVVLPGGAAPVLSWSLPAGAAGPVAFEVEVSQRPDMAGARRLEPGTAASVVLTSLPAGTHYWRVRARMAGGRWSAYSPVERFATTAPTGVEAAAPAFFGLKGVYPNPMRQQGAVEFDLPAAAHARVALYDMLGREVAVMADGPASAGAHRLAVSAAGLPPGVYLVRLTAAGFIATHPFVVGR